MSVSDYAFPGAHMHACSFPPCCTHGTLELIFSTSTNDYSTYIVTAQPELLCHSQVWNFTVYGINAQTVNTEQNLISSESEPFEAGQKISTVGGVQSDSNF